VRRLLIRPGAIGDCILALPELEAARADYTELWAPRPILPLIQFADRTRAIPDTGLDLIGVAEGPRETACLHDLATFDSIYSWYGSNHPEFRDAVRHLPFTFFPAQPINVMGTPRIRVPPHPIENFAVIQPFSSSPKKNWPLDSFRDLAGRINVSLQIPVKWCIGPEEHLDGAFDKPIRIDNLYDLGCWLATARLYIGNDSGITHLAAAVGVPTVAIFMTTDPRVWAPPGDHVTILENPSVDDVLAAASRSARPSGAGPCPAN
jgi:heptosyltransferase-3